MCATKEWEKNTTLHEKGNQNGGEKKGNYADSANVPNIIFSYAFECAKTFKNYNPMLLHISTYS